MREKLIWFSFDPFQKNLKSQQDALRAAAAYASAISARIQPVYFADRFRETDAESHFFPLFPLLEVCSLTELENAAKRNWGKLESGARIETLPLKILSHGLRESPSLEEKTRALSAAAKKAGVEFIVLQTKATSGLKRLVLGSFAETFLLNATVPILLIPPDVRRLSRPRKVLFSTDLSAASFLAFKRVCPTLKGLNAKVVLYYHLELPESTLQMLKSRERSLIDLDKVIESAKPALEEKAQDFLELALCYQINAAFKIGADLRLISKAEAILETAEELDIDCIALASQSGKLATSFIGATSRSVARAAKCPVLIYRTGD